MYHVGMTLCLTKTGLYGRWIEHGKSSADIDKLAIKRASKFKKPVQDALHDKKKAKKLEDGKKKGEEELAKKRSEQSPEPAPTQEQVNGEQSASTDQNGTDSTLRHRVSAWKLRVSSLAFLPPGLRGNRAHQGAQDEEAPAIEMDQVPTRSDMNGPRRMNGTTGTRAI